MDTWSDQNCQPYLAMTAHWIAKVGEMAALRTKVALLTFHCVCGTHNGPNLVKIVTDLLDRAGITVKVKIVLGWQHDSENFKVGHITMDNAANDDTMMQDLEHWLDARDIPFDVVDRRVMCYSHVVDLASRHVISGESSSEGDGPAPNLPAEQDALVRDPIALGHNVVWVIWASGAHRDTFDIVIDNGNLKGLFKWGQPSAIIMVKKLQLLWSVPTWWDLVYSMLRYLHELQLVCHCSLFDSSCC